MDFDPKWIYIQNGFLVQIRPLTPDPVIQNILTKMDFWWSIFFIISQNCLNTLYWIKNLLHDSFLENPRKTVWMKEDCSAFYCWKTQSLIRSRFWPQKLLGTSRRFSLLPLLSCLVLWSSVIFIIIREISVSTLFNFIC